MLSAFGGVSGPAIQSLVAGTVHETGTGQDPRRADVADQPDQHLSPPCCSTPSCSATSSAMPAQFICPEHRFWWAPLCWPSPSSIAIRVFRRFPARQWFPVVVRHRTMGFQGRRAGNSHDGLASASSQTTRTMGFQARRLEQSHDSPGLEAHRSVVIAGLQTKVAWANAAAT